MHYKYSPFVGFLFIENLTVLPVRRINVSRKGNCPSCSSSTVNWISLLTAFNILSLLLTSMLSVIMAMTLSTYLNQCDPLPLFLMNSSISSISMYKEAITALSGLPIAKPLCCLYSSPLKMNAPKLTHRYGILFLCSPVFLLAGYPHL